MMNEFVEAIKNNSSDSEDDPSSERYNELKREEADVERGTPSEKRYKELKDKAKQEMMENEESSPEDSEEDAEDHGEGFVTH
ncbi:MAG: hypothetical protein J07AB43_08050 [Candidatus Nanosalina sp. J07AB43]|nr:MAG: hypothetical protein J07AB43_08050 [Candidatus Nanosalina sp. J07AB43]